MKKTVYLFVCLSLLSSVGNALAGNVNRTMSLLGETYCTQDRKIECKFYTWPGGIFHRCKVLDSAQNFEGSALEMFSAVGGAVVNSSTFDKLNNQNLASITQTFMENGISGNLESGTLTVASLGMYTFVYAKANIGGRSAIAVMETWNGWFFAGTKESCTSS